MERSAARIALALAVDPYDIERELGHMCLGALRNLGHSSFLVSDGDRKGLEADILLLLGDCYRFPLYSELLYCRSGRPRTALWQLHSLPAPGLTGWAEKVGLCTCWMQGNAHFQPEWMQRFLKAVLSASAASKVKRRLSIALSHAFHHSLSRSPVAAFRQLDQGSRDLMMRRYAWIRQNHAAGWLDHLFVSSVAKQTFLRRRGISSHLVPVGYHASMGRDLGLRRDIDVLFIGGSKGRSRQAPLDRIYTALSKLGMRTEVIGNGCYGDERMQLLNRARVSLNLVNYSWDLPGIRFLLSIACGALVVSEVLDDPTPYRAGRHFVQAPSNDLASVAAYYAQNDEERAMIVHAASDFIRQDLTLEYSLGRMLEVCRVNSTFSSDHSP